MADNVLKTTIKLQVEGEDKVRKSIEKIVAAERKRHDHSKEQSKQRTAQIDQFIQKQNLRIKAEQRVTENIQKQQQAIRTLQANLLGVGLTALFGGMALKNLADSALRSLINTYALVTGETSAFNQESSRLAGAWEYLKFTIMDALMQSGLITWFIEGLIGMIHWLSALSDVVKVGFGIFLGALFLAGTGLIIVGQIMLGVNGILSLMTMNLVPFIMGFLTAIIIIGLVGVAIYLLYKIWTSNMSGVEKVMYSVLVVLGLIVIAAAVLGFAITAPLIIWGLLIGVIIGLFLLLVEHMGGVKNAFKAIGIFALAILAFIGDAIINALVTPFKFFIGVINAAISAMHALGFGTNIKKIQLPETLGWSNKVWEMRNNLLAEVEAQKTAEQSSLADTTGDAAKTDALGNFTNTLNNQKTIMDNSQLNIGTINMTMPEGSNPQDMVEQLKKNAMIFGGSPQAD